MEEEFAKFLHEKKIKEHVRELLEREDITSLEIFKCLRNEELTLLFNRGLSVGQFSLLYKLWLNLQERRERSPTKYTKSATLTNFSGNSRLWCCCSCITSYMHLN